VRIGPSTKCKGDKWSTLLHWSLPWTCVLKSLTASFHARPVWTAWTDPFWPVRQGYASWLRGTCGGQWTSAASAATYTSKTGRSAVYQELSNDSNRMGEIPSCFFLYHHKIWSTIPIEFFGHCTLISHIFHTYQDISQNIEKYRKKWLRWTADLTEY
jgi:hypothetical protein